MFFHWEIDQEDVDVGYDYRRLASLNHKDWASKQKCVFPYGRCLSSKIGWCLFCIFIRA